MTETVQPSRLDMSSLVSSASVEITSRGHQLEELRDAFSPGRDVTITFLPGDDYRHTVATAAALRRAGFWPVPHLAAREIASREALDDFLARARGEADVRRILLIAGDVARARGPFRSSLDICASGLIEAHGVSAVSIAGYPEGHPYLDASDAFASLAARRDWGRAAGVRVSVISQFCFRSGPILDWMSALEAFGLDAPVIVGLAGPATPASLMKFALRCGVGASLQSLRGQIGRFGRLLSEAGPDDVANGLASAAKAPALVGLHFFPFGGLRKTSDWIRARIEQDASQSIGRAPATAGDSREWS
ncbi:MAG TPA: methylenetetrahydrofolate reductase [Roseiarcus sp.]|nr:methylenetetrahydrofolate reductase [Roseiarcus sp.]